MKTALLILIFNAMVFAQGPSLGDVARQERARQKSNTGNIKVTNETLGTAAALPPGSEPVKSEAEPGKPLDGKAEAKSDEKTEAPYDEATWRDAFKKARDEVKRAEDRALLVQLELNKLNMDFLTRSDIYNREGQLKPLIDAKNEELAASEKAANDAREKLDRLEIDLRRSGSPIGWSR
jgi:hypothetical protein